MRLLIGLIIIPGILSHARSAEAFAVYNRTGQKMTATVTAGGSWSSTISAGSDAACPWYEKVCTGGSRGTELTLDIRLGWFMCVITMTSDGYVHVFEDERAGIQFNGQPAFPGDYPKNYRCVSRRADDSAVAILPPGVRDQYDYPVPERHVRFMATADPQFNTEGKNEKPWTLAADLLKKMGERLKGDMRGILVAGDLTSSTQKQEWDAYYNALVGRLRYVYDGVGNHDYSEKGPVCVKWGDVSQGPQGDAQCRSPGAILDAISHRYRSTQFTRAGGEAPSIRDYGKVTGFHYSWDWHDVHFVQLNLFVGHKATDVDNFQLDPYGSYSFLKQDLEAHVGSSWRPVVLVHHYPPGDDAPGPWQKPYWNLLKDYNVIAILVGHAHTPHDQDWWRIWSKPAGAEMRVDGRNELRTIVVGSALDDDANYKDPKTGLVRVDDNIVAFTEFTIKPKSVAVSRMAHKLNQNPWEFEKTSYPITSTVPATFVLVHRETGHCLDPKGYSGATGVLVQTYRCDAGLDQAFRYEQGIEEQRMLYNAKSGACLSAKGDGSVELKTCDGSESRWKVTTPDTWGTISGGNRCLGLNDKLPALQNCGTANALKWAAVQLPPSRPTEKSFLFVNKATGNCLDPWYGDGAPGRGVGTYRCDGGLDQAFHLASEVAGEKTTLKSAASKACLNVEGTRGDPGNKIDLASCTAEQDQSWTYGAATGPWSKLHNAQRNLCLTTSGPDQVSLQTCTGTDTQMWMRVPLPSP